MVVQVQRRSCLEAGHHQSADVSFLGVRCWVSNIGAISSIQSKPIFLSSVSVSTRRWRKTGRPISNSSHVRSISAITYLMLDKARIPDGSCKIVRGAVRVRENAKCCGFERGFSAADKCDFFVAVIFLIPFSADFLARLGDTMLSSLPSSQCPVWSRDILPSDTVMTQDGGECGVVKGCSLFTVPLESADFSLLF